MEREARAALANLLGGLVLLAIVAVGWHSLATNETLATYDFGTDPGPALMPRLLLWVLGLGAVGLVGTGAWQLGHARGGGGGRRADRRLVDRLVLPGLFVLTLAVYLRALAPLGFRAATFLFCAAWTVALTWRFDGRLGRGPTAVALVSAGLITAGIYLVFKVFVKVPLP